MRVAAYCGRDWAKAMRGSTGVKPVTSPPLEAQSPELYEYLEKAARGDVLALNLHGYAGQESYLGQWERQVGPTALTARDVLEHRWDGAVVFLEVCFSASGVRANRAIPQAFYERGARLVVGSQTEAYGRMRATLPLPGFDGEADRLLTFFLFWLKRRGAGRALALAKRTLRLWSWPLDEEDEKTLESFTIIGRCRNDETKVV